ncbi:MAG: hypothetical protein J0M15_04630 [Deltaproteobacteria bacterium]|jgi:flagellar operon protein|nr:hypothetical protein [Deltaproteobacteria bacterium]
MDIKKIGQLDTLMPNPVGKNYIPGQGPSFKETLAKTSPTETSKLDLKKSLQGLQNLGVVDTGIKFSNHAIDRMNSRGISFKQEDLSKLNEAVDRAASKGSKDSLILMNDTALIVSVKNRTVVTVMDKATLKENVFTNIDSTIVM